MTQHPLWEIYSITGDLSKIFWDTKLTEYVEKNDQYSHKLLKQEILHIIFIIEKMIDYQLFA